MTVATDKLERSRRAILDLVARRERRHDPREPAASGSSGPAGDAGAPEPGAGWFGQVGQALQTWWRYHPAHMVGELAAPLMRGYARRKPWQLVGVAAAAGAALTFARPWKLISLTTLAVAVLKSSQLSSLLMAALSAADYRKDMDRPE